MAQLFLKKSNTLVNIGGEKGVPGRDYMDENGNLVFTTIGDGKGLLNNKEIATIDDLHVHENANVINGLYLDGTDIRYDYEYSSEDITGDIIYSTMYSGNYNPDTLKDGKTGCWLTSTSDSIPYIGYHLQTPMTITKCTLTIGSPNSHLGEVFAVMQISENGTDWRDISKPVQVPSEKDKYCVLEADEYTVTEYVRIYFNGKIANDSYYGGYTTITRMVFETVPDYTLISSINIKDYLGGSSNVDLSVDESGTITYNFGEDKESTATIISDVNVSDYVNDIPYTAKQLEVASTMEYNENSIDVLVPDDPANIDGDLIFSTQYDTSSNAASSLKGGKNGKWGTITGDKTPFFGYRLSEKMAIDTCEVTTGSPNSSQVGNASIQISEDGNTWVDISDKVPVPNTAGIKITLAANKVCNTNYVRVFFDDILSHTNKYGGYTTITNITFTSNHGNAVIVTDKNIDNYINNLPYTAEDLALASTMRINEGNIEILLPDKSVNIKGELLFSSQYNTTNNAAANAVNGTGVWGTAMGDPSPYIGFKLTEGAVITYAEVITASANSYQQGKAYLQMSNNGNDWVNISDPVPVPKTANTTIRLTSNIFYSTAYIRVFFDDKLSHTNQAGGYTTIKSVTFTSTYNKGVIITDKNINEYLVSNQSDNGMPLAAVAITDQQQEIQTLRFGIDENGNYGYYKVGADTVTPFNAGNPTGIKNPSYVSYNGVVLPKIPVDYKYCYIRKNNVDSKINAICIMDTDHPVVFTEASEPSNITWTEDVHYVVLSCDIPTFDSVLNESLDWSIDIDEIGVNTFTLNDSNNTFIWASHDVPFDTVDNAEIAFSNVSPAIGVR